MGTKLVVRSFKLQPETLAQIQIFADENGLTFSEAMREAARGLGRMAHHKEGTDALAAKLENVASSIRILEQNISQLVDVLTQNFELNEPRLLFLMDRVQRLYNGSRLNSALAEHTLNAGDLATWQDKKAKIIDQFKNEEMQK